MFKTMLKACWKFQCVLKSVMHVEREVSVHDRTDCTERYRCMAGRTVQRGVGAWQDGLYREVSVHGRMDCTERCWCMAGRTVQRGVRA